ncbi:MAG TPA: hypothetical protein VIP77_14240 [Jiangellaceae bacterium]
MSTSFAATPGRSPAPASERTREDPERLIRLLRDSDSATRTLAAWRGCPVRIELVSRREDVATVAELTELETSSQQPVQRREVRLLDAGDRVLSEASAVVVLVRLPHGTARALQDGDVPLGLLLAPLHPRRHTLSVVRLQPSPGADHDLLFEITARLDVGGRPTALVRERYRAEALS